MVVPQELKLPSTVSRAPVATANASCTISLFGVSEVGPEIGIADINHPKRGGERLSGPARGARWCRGLTRGWLTGSCSRCLGDQYSSKVLQRRRRPAAFSEVRTHSAHLNDAQRGAGRNFASKGLGVRVPLAPPLVTVGLPLLGSCIFQPVQQKVQQSRPPASSGTPEPRLSSSLAGGPWPQIQQPVRHAIARRRGCSGRSAMTPAWRPVSATAATREARLRPSVLVSHRCQLQSVESGPDKAGRSRLDRGGAAGIVMPPGSKRPWAPTDAGGEDTGGLGLSYLVATQSGRRHHKARRRPQREPYDPAVNDVDVIHHTAIYAMGQTTTGQLSRCIQRPPPVP
jgi:hypothetical protein